MIKISFLVENKARDGLECEHGLSIGIENGNHKIIFDVGSSDMFLRNASKMGFDIDEVDTVILSHAHYDHSNGLPYLNNKKLITHPDSFTKTYRKSDNQYIGLPISMEEAAEKYALHLTDKPYDVARNIIFLGQIPRTNDFECKVSFAKREDGQDDFILSDSAIVIVREKDMIIITGCSHAGIINIIDYAKKVTGKNKIATVIGGFHLRSLDEIVYNTVQVLQKEDIEELYPTHCTSDDVIDYMINQMGHEKVKRVATGDILCFKE